MEPILLQWLLGLLGLVIIGLVGGLLALYRRFEKSDEGKALRIKVLEQEVKGLRQRSHEYGNWIESLRSKVMDLERDVLRIRDGKNGHG